MVQPIASLLDGLFPLVPDPATFPTVEERTSWLAHFLTENRGVDCSVVGSSLEGRPIHLLRFNPEAEVSVLLMGYVHANEPAGFPLLQFLSEQLVEEDNPISRLFPRVQFLFLLVSDPDGAYWNEGAYANRSLRAYLMNYYRQSLENTAIYSLPYAYNGHYVNAPCKEARAIMRVIQTYRPFQLYELHNCEFGATMLWTKTVGQQPALLNRIGSYISGYIPFAPSPLPEQQMLTIPQKSEMPVGAGTVDYARRWVDGAAVVNLELPLWWNPMENSQEPATVDAGVIWTFYHSITLVASELFDSFLDELMRDAETIDDDPEVLRLSQAIIERANLGAYAEKNLGDLPSPFTQADQFSAAGSEVILLLRDYALVMRLAAHMNTYTNNRWTQEQQKLEEIIREALDCAMGDLVPGTQPTSIAAITKGLLASLFYTLQADEEALGHTTD